jgi:hypothetical protein
MPYAPFDPTRAVTFDLSMGQVHLQDSQPTVIVPAVALADLCAAAGTEATAGLGRAWGQALGRRLLARLGGPHGSRDEIDGASLQVFVEHLGGELALAGLGALTLERWGRALVFVVEGGVAPTALVCALFEGALEAATGRVARCVQIVKEKQRARFLVSSPSATQSAQAWLAAGMSWGEVLAKLHAAQEAPEPRGDA